MSLKPDYVCLEDHCNNLHGCGQGRHRCPACKLARAERDRARGRRIVYRKCSACGVYKAHGEYDHGQLSRKQPRCKACVAEGIQIRRAEEAGHACQPGGWAIGAPGW